MGQLLILSFGLAYWNRVVQDRSKVAEKETKRVRPPKPFKKMTAAEYQQYLSNQGL